MSNGTSLHLLVVSPERKVLEEPAADSVTLPAADGYVTILPRHAPLIATLGVGVATYRKGGRETSLAIVGGFFEVSDDRVTVLADEALAAEEIDVLAARRELEEGRTALQTAAGKEQRRARLMIERAQAKLAVASART